MSVLTHTQTQRHTHIHTHIHTQRHTHTHIHTHIHTHTHTHTVAYIHTYIHTYRVKPALSDCHRDHISVSSKFDDSNFYFFFLQISSSLVRTFGKDTDGGQWMVSYLIDKILSNLVGWSSEAKVLEDTLELLLSLVDKKDRFVSRDVCVCVCVIVILKYSC